MEFTWRHIFILAKRMFNYTENELADRFKVNRSTINRYKKESYRGKFGLKVDAYKNVFAPPKRDPKTLDQYLKNLKDTLDEDVFPASVRNLSFNSYEQYIRHLLELAERNIGSEQSMEQPVTEISIIRCNSNEDVFNFFNQSLLEYRIKFFIEGVDPTILMDAYYVEQCDEFIKKIKSDDWIPFRASAIAETTNMIQKIYSFADILDEYVSYLGHNMRLADPAQAPTIFVPLYRDENPKWSYNFVKDVKKYRQQLCSVCLEINNIFGEQE